MKIKCLIVDDEQLAREMLEVYVSKTPELHLVHLCKSAKEAQDIIKEKDIDLIFLDIQMPQLSGIDFLNQLPKPRPKAIFTTAYPNYALKGFELDIIDYLLKPISLERFQQAVSKASAVIKVEEKAERFDEHQKAQEQTITVHSEHKHHKILVRDIIFIESLKEYVRYHTVNGKIMELNSLKKLETILPNKEFIRIHRSYIVAINQIQSYQNGNLILKTPQELPIGKTYKKVILEKLFKNS